MTCLLYQNSHFTARPMPKIMVAFDHDRSTPRSRSCKFADRPPRANPLFFLHLRKWTPQKTFFPFAASHRQTERERPTHRIDFYRPSTKPPLNVHHFRVCSSFRFQPHFQQSIGVFPHRSELRAVTNTRTPHTGRDKPHREAFFSIDREKDLR